VSFSKKSPHLRLQLAKHRDQFPSSRLLVTRIWKCFDIAAVVVLTHRSSWASAFEKYGLNVKAVQGFSSFTAQ
jgi:hypothetical protein